MVSRGSRRNVLVVGIGVALIVVVGLAIWLWWPNRGEPPAATGWPSASAEPPAGTARFTSERATAINSAIATRDRVGFADAVAIAPGTSIPDRAITELADSGPWDFDLATLRYIDEASASVSARTSGPQLGTWQVYLLLDAGVWKIAATERQPG